jgi:DNA-directed RNA polymerase subunit RPC12/RpoP
MARKRKRDMFDPVELARGRQVELEHVDEPSFAEEIAKDHLREHPRYYSRLRECDVEGSEGRSSCPTCHRNPRAHAPEGSYYMLDEWLCSKCGWTRLVSPEYEIQMKRADCPRCGHHGLVKVPDEFVDTRWRPQENPRRSYIGARAMPGFEEEEQPERCLECGRRRYYDGRLREWICPNGCTEY